MADPTWIGYGGLVASALSAIAAYLAIRQTIVQRKESIRPQLLINDLDLYRISMNENSYTAMPLSGMDIESIKPDLINSGLGTALNIEIVWEYPIKEKLESFLESLHVTFESKKLPANTLFKINGGGIILRFDMYKNYSHSYLLPINTVKEPTKIILPPLILTLLLNELNLLRNLNGEVPSIIDGPSLNILFSDVNGKKYSINYLSQFHLREHGAKPYENTYSGSLMFQVSKRSKTAQILQRIRKSYAEFMEEHNHNKYK
ncbi:hypothetical protein [Citrobacter freundii]|uniref:hypothetical protein n=1 Tax=Citrobacter freundii TaxID=546 RepID=UPI001902C26F|nr:hypothetical protein [Citrobacter freundii]MBJ9129958.1 hypothetical protein [Citrobacter freundii]